MNKYSDITFRYIKENKKRTIFTIIGLILSLSLISGVGFFAYSFRDVMLNRTLLKYGDYEVSYYGVNKSDIELLKNDVDIATIAIEGDKGVYKKSLQDDAIIDIRNYNKEGIKDVFESKLLEGRVPENSEEIIIDNRYKNNFEIKIGDEINLVGVEKGDKVAYKVVGFYYPSVASGNSYYAKTIGEDNIYDGGYTVYLSLIGIGGKDKVKLIYDKADNMSSKPMVDINNDLLALSGQSSYSGINAALFGMAGIVLGIIIISTVFLIYNFINISLAERMTQFAILRSIGGTPKQIRNIVIKEGLVMCLLAVPFGVLFGYFGVNITVRILKDRLINMFETEFVMGFYPEVILITLVLGIITILLATYGPAKRAGKISPVDILKNNGNVTKGKEKHVKGTLIRRIFGLEGWIAYKNIRKNTKGFIITILSLTISLVMFIVFNTLNIKQNEDLEYLKKTSIMDYLTYTNREDSENMKKDIEKISGVDKIYEKTSMIMPLLVDKENYIEEDSHNVYDTRDIATNYKLLPYSKIYYYNDIALKEIGLTEKDLGENGVVLINNRVSNNGDKMLNKEITNYKVGDKIKIPKSLIGVDLDYEENFTYMDSEKFKDNITKDIEENNVFEVVVKKVIEKDILSNEMYKFGMILPKGIYDSLDEKKDSGKIIGISLEKGDKDQIEKSLSEIENSLSKYGYAFMDYYHGLERERDMWAIINTFIYGFIIMITLISVVNIVSTISLNILLKKRELATLGVVGMEKSKINKMVALEGCLHGVIASVWGGIVSVILVKIMIRMLSNGFSVSSSIPVMPFIIGFIGVMVITLISSLLPLRRLRKISLVESIRNEE